VSLSKSNRAMLLCVLTLLLGTAASASAAFFIITPPRALLPTLRTYPQAAASWWKWALSQPADRNPILDTEGTQCANGQPAFGVWYLAGSDQSAPVRRTCTVPKFRTLVFPVINVLAPWIVTAPDDIPTDADIAALRESARRIADATDLTLTIDGVAVRNLGRFFEESTPVALTLPENNLFGVEAGLRLEPGFDAGYYVAVSGLLPGKHTLAWSGASEALGFSQDITYEITVRGF
jgi:hypothetical protein